MKMTSVVGNASMFITGKLTEMIEGDYISETNKGKTITNSEQGIETSVGTNINRHAQTEIQQNSGEKSNNF